MRDEAGVKGPARLAIVLSHPVQYYSPWFRAIASREELQIKVFYLWNSGITTQVDRKFDHAFSWDIDLLSGYDYEFVPNVSQDPGTHHFRGLHNPELIPKLYRWSPDAILLFGYAWLSHLRVIGARKLSGIPLILRGDSHALLPDHGLKSALRHWSKRLLFRRFSRFLAVGEANRRYLTEHGVPQSKVCFCPHSVDNARFRSAGEVARAGARQWKEALGIEPDRPVALFAGKFEDKKRPLDLLRAFARVEEEGHGGTGQPAPALLFVGGGKLDAAIRREAGERLGKTIYLAPFQNQSEMPKVYVAADVLVLPSYGNGETWGLAVNEAMSLGVPAIVSSHVGCSLDLVLPGETGWRFDAGDIKALSACLREALSEPGTLKRLGEKARAKVDEYSYETSTAALVDCVRTLGAQSTGAKKHPRHST